MNYSFSNLMDFGKAMKQHNCDKKQFIIDDCISPNCEIAYICDGCLSS